MFGDNMLGFVSALSSTLAIVVLISSVLLVNLLTFSLKKSEKEFQLKITEAATQSDNKQKGVLDAGQNDRLNNVSISKHLISSKELPPRDANISAISTGCTFGNNFSYEVASKISALNYIILEKHFTDSNTKITLEKPKLSESKVNDCWINMGG